MYGGFWTYEKYNHSEFNLDDPNHILGTFCLKGDGNAIE